MAIATLRSGMCQIGENKLAIAKSDSFRGVFEVAGTDTAKSKMRWCSRIDSAITRDALTNIKAAQLPSH
jgi:hypothetical protein